MTTPIADEDLIALLEDGPKALADLAQWLQQPKPAVSAHLGRLARAGLVKRTGTAKRWCLASFVAPNGRPKRTGPRATVPAVASPPTEDDDETFEGDDETAAADEETDDEDSAVADAILAELDAPRRGPGRRQLRQLQPAPERLTKDTPPAWWARKYDSQEDYYATARQEFRQRMEGKPIKGDRPRELR